MGGGASITDKHKFIDDKLVPVGTGKRIKVSFTSEMSQILQWNFVPQQRKFCVLPGETALSFYRATNKLDKDIIYITAYIQYYTR